MDQTDYVRSLSPVTNKELIGQPGDELASEAVQKDYLSVIGGLAYCMLTQSWVAVYLVALQRKMQVATNREVRRLNALLRYLQENPQELIFKAMYCDKVIEAHRLNFHSGK